MTINDSRALNEQLKVLQVIDALNKHGRAHEHVPHSSQSKSGFTEPTNFFPSGFSISIHHMTFSVNGVGAIAWTS